LRSEQIKRVNSFFVDRKVVGNEPMNPEDIASHEPTAVRRDQDTKITQEGQAGTNTEEAREKYRKKGMTEV
jgi:hypothetical protein